VDRKNLVSSKKELKPAVCKVCAEYTTGLLEIKRKETRAVRFNILCLKVTVKTETCQISNVQIPWNFIINRFCCIVT
jgi:hypothetical protein